ncbi:hypothetical protein EOW65_18605 [Sinirhodobacter ferrireducens]|uniref:Uncharacterized protein n=1 Tax=Paenirhodobacter ferrireducens TaxID=1215032 RepID=A0A443L6B8_9RHOB|nr:hypothetical protein [Sinirhodobacter ferrireducens]RWR44558.1 hypothetical protein EOW65_18605 [Sinirhodobacter ferrireducens]
MTLPTMTPPPAAPSRNNPDKFPAEADAMMAYFAPFVAGLNNLVSGLNTLSAQLLAAAAAADASASAASTSRTGASTAASTATSAAAAAAAARDATLAAYDNFDDRYLGAKSAAPAVDNDGAALMAGALYFDRTAEKMMLWTGSAWVAAYVSAEGLLTAASNLSDLASAATARTNLGLGILATKSPANYKLSDALWTGGTSTTQGMPTPAQVAAAVQALAPPGVGEGQTWQNVAASRSIGTAYQNTTGRPITVLVQGGNSGSGSLQISADGVSYLIVAEVGGSQYIQVSAVIPSGHYYKVIGTSINNARWCELR